MQINLSDIYKDKDGVFSVAPEFLERELHTLFADEERKGKKISDKLIKVRLKNGADSFILVHVEIEGDAPSYDPRVFKYYYRIYDRYETDITTLLIYVGDQVPLSHNVYNCRYFCVYAFFDVITQRTRTKTNHRNLPHYESCKSISYDVF